MRELKRRERRVSLKGLDDGFENVLYDEVTGYDFQAWQATDIHCLLQVKTLNYCEGAAAYMRGVFLFFLKRLLIHIKMGHRWRPRLGQLRVHKLPRVSRRPEK